MDWIFALSLALLAFVAAVAGLFAVSALQIPTKRRGLSLFTEAMAGSSAAGSAVFLFDGETLVDATPSGRQILASSSGRGSNWLRLIGHLSLYFPSIEADLKHLPETGQILLEGRSSKDKRLILQASHQGGLMRLVISDPALDGAPIEIDALSHRAMLSELDDLRDTLGQAPMLIWRENDKSEVVWANGAYMLKAMATLPHGAELGWPLLRLFEKHASQTTAQGQRATVTQQDGNVSWYDLVGITAGDDRLIFALPADAAVGAETALRDFMQTLTKTFAQLPIGLAIFDQQRLLQLFNPALLDLTSLPVDFLSMRPSLLSVLDALRDRNMIPEPKDYRSWRRQLVELERAAASGLYEETWDLPDGQTFRVVGRPHPNGALALMIEDITNEVSRSRRYRLDLEMGQAVVDELEDGVAVFSASGQLVMSNTAYSILWAHDPEKSRENDSIRSVVAFWRANSAPGALWSEAEEYVSTVGNRVAWRAETRLLDGRLLSCRFAPLSGGATMVSFRPSDPSDLSRPVLAEADSLKSA